MKDKLYTDAKVLADRRSGISVVPSRWRASHVSYSARRTILNWCSGYACFLCFGRRGFVRGESESRAVTSYCRPQKMQEYYAAEFVN